MKKFLLGLLSIGFTSNILSQSLAINTDGSTANTSALLDVKSINKGMLIPRMSKGQRNAIATPANGLMVYVNAPDTVGLCIYDGSVWKWMEDKGSGWSLTGNAGTSPITNYIGTNDFNDLSFRVNGGQYMRLTKEAELGISEIDPKYALDIRTGWAAVNNCTNNGVRIKRNFANNDCETGLLLGFPVTVNEENNALIWNYGNIGAQPKNMLFGLGNVEIMRLTDNRELGINVQSPKYNLDITTGGTSLNPCTRGGLRLNTFTNNSDCDKGLFLGFDTMGVQNKISLWNFTPNANSTNQFFRFGFGPNFSQEPPPTGFGEAMRILPPGQGVGIGTTNPLAMLHVMNSTGSGSPGGLMVSKPGLPGPEFRGFYTGLGVLNNPSGNDGVVWNYQNAGIKFGTNDIERMTINSGGTVIIAGNVGIGETNPGFPLNFASAAGNKISLSGNSGGGHYGLGVQSNLLQIHTASVSDNIGFGYGSSGSFTERAKIINDGELGMSLTGRMQLFTGIGTAGIWLANNANTTNPGFMGMRNDNLVGFYGSANPNNNGWGLLMNTNDGNVGIGTDTPAEKLDVIGKIKITDGTQAAGRILASDASGVGTWVNNIAITPAVTGVFAGSGATFGNGTAAGSSTPFVYCNVYIDLPPGKWMVFGTYLLNGALVADAGIFIRTLFSDSNTGAGTCSPNVISGCLISGTLLGPVGYGIANGQTIINNITSGVKRYYMWANMEKYGTTPTAFSINALGSNVWSENQLAAIPMN
jgi:hypothetical protein